MSKKNPGQHSTSVMDATHFLSVKFLNRIPRSLPGKFQGLIHKFHAAISMHDIKTLSVMVWIRQFRAQFEAWLVGQSTTGRALRICKNGFLTSTTFTNHFCLKLHRIYSHSHGFSVREMGIRNSRSRYKLWCISTNYWRVTA